MAARTGKQRKAYQFQVWFERCYVAVSGALSVVAGDSHTGG